MTNNTAEEIDIPKEVFTPCPKEEFSLTNINTHCLLCDYFNGFFKKAISTKAPFSKRFTVKCAHPSSRDIIEVKF